jgi:hypothetical protein
VGLNNILLQYYTVSLFGTAVEQESRALIYSGFYTNQNASLRTAFVVSVNYDDITDALDFFKANDMRAHITYSSFRENFVAFILRADNVIISKIQESHLRLIALAPLPHSLKVDSSISALMLGTFSSASSSLKMTLKSSHPIMSHVAEQNDLEYVVMFQKTESGKYGHTFLNDFYQNLNPSKVMKAFDSFHGFWVSENPQDDPEELYLSKQLNFVESSIYSDDENPWHFHDLLIHATASDDTDSSNTGRKARKLNPRKLNPRTLHQPRIFAAGKTIRRFWRSTVDHLLKSDSFLEKCEFNSFVGASGVVRVRRDALHIRIKRDAALHPSKDTEYDVGIVLDNEDATSFENHPYSKSRHAISHACLSALVAITAADPNVVKIAVNPLLRLQNNIARAVIQGGSGKSLETLSLAGLDGSGIVIGISDTGIDQESCYFKDSSRNPVRTSTVQNPVIDMKQRKVVQYIDYSGSQGDYANGHGSHTSGTLAGSCEDETTSENIYHGMAPSAKLAFLDIGVDDAANDLMVPWDLSDELYPPAYQAGARLHSNSWGGGYW